MPDAGLLHFDDGGLVAGQDQDDGRHPEEGANVGGEPPPRPGGQDAGVAVDAVAFLQVGFDELPMAEGVQQGRAAPAWGRILEAPQAGGALRVARFPALWSFGAFGATPPAHTFSAAASPYSTQARAVIRTNCRYG